MAKQAKVKPKTPWEEGYGAYFKGVVKCPYDPLCGANSLWNDGWWEAHSEATRCSEPREG